MNENNPNSETKPISKNQKQEVVYDKSGCCVLVVIIIKDICYTANIGDSRAVLGRCINGGIHNYLF